MLIFILRDSFIFLFIIIMKMPHRDISILKQLPKLVSAYRRPSFSKATLQILYSFLPYIALWVAMYFLLDISYVLVLLLAIPTGLFLGRIFIIQHDCGHQSFTASPRMNGIVWYICSIFTRIPYHYRSKSHSFHHNHTGMLREFRDIGDIQTLTVEEYNKLSWRKKIGYRIFRSTFVMFIVVPIRYILVQIRFPLITKEWRNKMPEYKSLLVNNLSLVAVYGLLRWLVGRQTLLMIQLPILVCYSTMLFWFFYIQHQHEHSYRARQDKWEYVRAAVQGSSFYDIPRIFHRLTGNIGYHHIHHLNASVPSYELARCFREQPLLQQVANRLTFRESLRCIRHHLRDEQQQKMISFRAYYRLYVKRQMA